MLGHCPKGDASAAQDNWRVARIARNNHAAPFSQETNT